MNEIIIYQFKKNIRGGNVIHTTCILKLGEVRKPGFRDKRITIRGIDTVDMIVQYAIKLWKYLLNIYPTTRNDNLCILRFVSYYGLINISHILLIIIGLLKFIIRMMSNNSQNLNLDYQIS